MFFEVVKQQRKACKAFAETRSPESRDEYFRLSDMIDAEIQRVDKIMAERKENENTSMDSKG